MRRLQRLAQSSSVGSDPGSSANPLTVGSESTQGAPTCQEHGQGPAGQGPQGAGAHTAVPPLHARAAGGQEEGPVGQLLPVVPGVAGVGVVQLLPVVPVVRG